MCVLRHTCAGEGTGITMADAGNRLATGALIGGTAVAAYFSAGAAIGVMADIGEYGWLGGLSMNAGTIGGLAEAGAAVATGTVLPTSVANHTGDLTESEINQIQSVVNQAGRPLSIVGSAARGARTAESDIDYVVSPSSLPYFDGLDSSLPGIDPNHGIIPGYLNPDMGQSIPFEPTETPDYAPVDPDDGSS